MRFPILIQATLLVSAACLILAGCGTLQEIGPREPPEFAYKDYTEFYIALYGSDANPGTRGKPFKSLEGARDAIRCLRQAGSLRGRVTVWIRGGTYYRTQTFELTEEDSGTEDAPVVYRAFGDETVRLAGGREIEAAWWEPVADPVVLARIEEPARDRLLQVDLKAHDIADYGELSISGSMFELFYGGKRLPLARYPNEGWMHIGQVVEVGEDGVARMVDGNKQGRTFQYTGDRPKRWLDAKEMTLHGFWWYGWTDEHVKIERIDTDKKQIALVRVPGGGIRKDQWFYALNLLEEIDQPGEWFLDRGKGIVYLWPPQETGTVPSRSGTRSLGTVPAVTAPSLLCSTLTEPLLVLNGTSYVTVRGLTLEVTRGVGVVLGGGTHNLLAGCIIRDIGSDAVVMDHGKKNGVLGCDIYDVGSTGIRLTGGNRSTLEPSGNYVVNNHIHHYAQRKKVYQPAVRMYGVGHRIAHNLIHDAPHQAIGYDGNDHRIEYNEIHHVVLESADAGVLYTGRDWTFRGNVVRYNFIHHIPHGPGLGTVGVYLDDCCCSTKIFGNVFYDMLKPAFIGGGRDNVVANNIFIECDTPVYLDNRGLRWDHFRPDGPMYDQLKQVRYDQPPWSVRYPKLARILDEHPQAPLGNVLVNNVSYKSTWRDPEKSCRETSKNHIDTPYMRIENNYICDEDPGFVDADNMNFQLKDDSIVYQEIPGFRRIPFDKIGLYPDEFRATWPPR